MENPRKLATQVKKEGRAMVNKNIKIFSLNKPIKDKSIIPSFICHKIGKTIGWNVKDKTTGNAAGLI